MMEAQIKSLGDLEIVRSCRRSVYARTCEFRFATRPLPAAVVMNFSCERISGLIKHGLYVWNAEDHK